MRFRARSARFLFAGLLLVGAGMVAGAPTAAAGSNESVVTARGSVGWFHDGDKVQVCDAKADGLSIEANYGSPVTRRPAASCTSPARATATAWSGTRPKARTSRSGCVTGMVSSSPSAATGRPRAPDRGGPADGG